MDTSAENLFRLVRKEHEGTITKDELVVLEESRDILEEVRQIILASA